MLYIFCAVVFYTLVLLPTAAQGLAFTLPHFDHLLYPSPWSYNIMNTQAVLSSQQIINVYTSALHVTVCYHIKIIFQ